MNKDTFLGDVLNSVDKENDDEFEEEFVSIAKETILIGGCTFFLKKFQVPLERESSFLRLILG